MTSLPQEITRNLDAHRSALACVRAMLHDNPEQAIDLYLACSDEERLDIACALAVQAAGYLSARCGGGEPGPQTAIRFADELLLDMAREPRA